jgi:hypothetical protein
MCREAETIKWSVQQNHTLKTQTGVVSIPTQHERNLPVKGANTKEDSPLSQSPDKQKQILASQTRDIQYEVPLRWEIHIDPVSGN